MSGNMLNLIKIGIAEGYGNFLNLTNMVGHNATRYHNLNVLPHALQHALPYIFSQINMDRP